MLDYDAISERYAELCRQPANGDVPVSSYWEDYLRRTRGDYGGAIPPYMRMQFQNFPKSMAGDVFMGEPAADGIVNPLGTPPHGEAALDSPPADVSRRRGVAEALSRWRRLRERKPWKRRR